MKNEILSHESNDNIYGLIYNDVFNSNIKDIKSTDTDLQANQIIFDNQIKLLQDEIHTIILKKKDQAIIFEHLIQKLKNIVNLHLNIANHFIKYNYIDISKKYIKKIRKYISDICEYNNDLDINQNNYDWKLLYIQIVFHYSNIYKKLENHHKSIYYLKKCITFQEDLEKKQIYIPQLENIYIALAESYSQIKKYHECEYYTHKAIEILKIILNIKKGISNLNDNNKGINEENDSLQNLDNKKFITLSYSYYLLGICKSMDSNKKKKSIEYFKKAYNIAVQHLGHGHEIARRYKTKLNESLNNDFQKSDIHLEESSKNEIKSNSTSLNSITKQQQAPSIDIPVNEIIQVVAPKILKNKIEISKYPVHLGKGSSESTPNISNIVTQQNSIAISNRKHKIDSKDIFILDQNGTVSKRNSKESSFDTTLNYKSEIIPHSYRDRAKRPQSSTIKSKMLIEMKGSRIRPQSGKKSDKFFSFFGSSANSSEILSNQQKSKDGSIIDFFNEKGQNSNLRKSFFGATLHLKTPSDPTDRFNQNSKSSTNMDQMLRIDSKGVKPSTQESKSLSILKFLKDSKNLSQKAEKTPSLTEKAFSKSNKLLNLKNSLLTDHDFKNKMDNLNKLNKDFIDLDTNVGKQEQNQSNVPNKLMNPLIYLLKRPPILHHRQSISYAVSTKNLDMHWAGPIPNNISNSNITNSKLFNIVEKTLLKSAAIKHDNNQNYEPIKDNKERSPPIITQIQPTITISGTGNTSRRRLSIKSHLGNISTTRDRLGTQRKNGPSSQSPERCNTSSIRKENSKFKTEISRNNKFEIIDSSYQNRFKDNEYNLINPNLIEKTNRNMPNMNNKKHISQSLANMLIEDSKYTGEKTLVAGDIIKDKNKLKLDMSKLSDPNNEKVHKETLTNSSLDRIKNAIDINKKAMNDANKDSTDKQTFKIDNNTFKDIKSLTQFRKFENNCALQIQYAFKKFVKLKKSLQKQPSVKLNENLNVFFSSPNNFKRSHTFKFMEKSNENHNDEFRVSRPIFLGLIKIRKNASFMLKKNKINQDYLNKSMPVIFSTKQDIVDEQQKDHTKKDFTSSSPINPRLTNSNLKMNNDNKDTEPSNVFARTDMIYKLLNSIRKYKIEHTTNIYGIFGTWSLQFHKYIEINGRIHLNFCYNLGNQSHFIKINIMPYLFEKNMFYSSIWPLLESHIQHTFPELNSNDYSIYYKDYFNKRKENLYLILPDIKIHNQSLSKLIDKEEQIIIKKMIIKLEYLIKYSFLKTKKISGIIYEYIGKNNKLLRIFNNKMIINNIKKKIYEHLRKISTNISLPIEQLTTNKDGNNIKLKLDGPEIEIYQTRKYLKRKDLNDISDLSEIEKDIALISSIQTKYQSKIQSTINKENDQDDDGNDTSLTNERHQIKLNVKESDILGKKHLFGNRKRKTKVSIVELKKREFIEEKIMKGLKIAKSTNEEYVFKNYTLTNPFAQREILLQSILKVDKYYFLSNLRVYTGIEGLDKIDLRNRDAFYFMIDVHKMNGDRDWKDHISLRWDELQLLTGNHIQPDIKQFILNKGFSLIQKKILLWYMVRNLGIKQSKLQLINNMEEFFKKNGQNSSSIMNNHVQFNRISSKTNNYMTNFVTYIKKNKLQKYIYFHVYSMFINDTNQQLSLNLSKNNTSDQESIAYKIEIVHLKDIKYGNSGEIVDKIKHLNGLITLNNYNTIRVLKNLKYYQQILINQERILLRIEFIYHNDQEIIKLTSYLPLRGILNYLYIKEEIIKERLINILQMSSIKLKEKALDLIISQENTLIGKKLIIKDQHIINEYCNHITNNYNELSCQQILLLIFTSYKMNYNQNVTLIKKHYYQGNIINLGKCYIEVSHFTINHLYKPDDMNCIKFKFVPFNSKTKYYKFMINSKDLRYYFNIEYPTNNHDKNMAIIINLINTISRTKKMVYSTLEIKLQHHSSFISPKCSYTLSNIMPKIIETKSIGARVFYDKFIDSKINESRIIIQCTKKQNGIYMIITIEHQKIFNYWTITIYIPKTCRKFTTIIHTSDFMSMNPQYLEKLCSTNNTIKRNKIIENNYAKFTKEFLKQKYIDSKSYNKIKHYNSNPIYENKFDSGMHESLTQSIININQSKIDKLSSKSQFFTKRTIEKNIENIMVNQPKPTQKQNILPYDINDLSKNILGYHEMKFWENIINEIVLKKTKKTHYLLNFNEFNGVLRENIYTNIVKISKTNEAKIEIFLENLHRKYDIFDTISPIPDISLGNHEFFIRIVLINKTYTYNYKFRLNQIFDLYNNDNSVGFDNIPKMKLLTSKKKLTLAKIQLLCKYMLYKINLWNLILETEDKKKLTKNNKHNNGILMIERKNSYNHKKESDYPYIHLENKKLIKQMTLLNKVDNNNNNDLIIFHEQELKLNCNNNIQYRIDDKHKYVNKIIIYRGILSIKPLQMISIVYNQKNKYFICYLYDLKNSWLLKKKLKMEEIISKIPHANIFLQNRLYYEVGKRIYKNCKNSLMIFSYLNKHKRE